MYYYALSQAFSLLYPHFNNESSKSGVYITSMLILRKEMPDLIVFSLLKTSSKFRQVIRCYYDYM